MRGQPLARSAVMDLCMAEHRFVSHPSSRMVCRVCGHTYGAGEHFHTDPRIDQLMAEIEAYLDEHGADAG